MAFLRPLVKAKSKMTTLVAMAAIGLAGYYLAPSSEPLNQNEKNAIEIREAMHGGFLKNVNTSHTQSVISEETRVVRTPHYNKFDVRQNAADSLMYFKKKNDWIANMTNGVNCLINQATIRANLRQRPGLLQLPSAEGWAGAFGDIANVTYDIDGGYPAEMMTGTWRDQYGDAGGFPRDGRPNPVLDELYVGNPWGAGGQLFVAVGNQFRDPGYFDEKPEVPKKKGGMKRPGAREQLQNRVRFERA